MNQRFAKSWTPAEDEALRASYVQGGVEAALAVLPQRTRHAIYNRAKALLGQTRARRWTKRDDAKLSLIWDAAHGLPWIARQLGRTPQATYQRALRIGLPCGCPQGYEYLTAAAQRCGYTVPQLRKRLVWAGFKVHAALCWAHGHVCKRTHVVDPQDVDDALERWHRTETRDAAARRVGVDRVTLAKRLARIGIAPTDRSHLRVTPEQVHQALALHVPGGHLNPRTLDNATQPQEAAA